jgi:mono/diheme cytochrome c family protein
MDGKRTWYPRLVLLLLVSIAVGVPTIAWQLQRRNYPNTLHARMAEAGGWAPADLTAVVGVPLTLRLTSDDVVHSFAIGQSEIPAVEVLPGEWSETALVFDKPGKYTYYCARWCGPNHWRMRGTIEVRGPEAEPESRPQPLYLALGLDIDAPHPAGALPARRPSASSGETHRADLSEKYQDPGYFRSHSPAEIWQALRSEPGLDHLPDEVLWDLTAYLWRSQTTSEALLEGQALYVQNCAACHGESGGGNGVFADDLIMLGEAEMSPGSEHARTRPADFTDPIQMLGASPALLEGKITRGGMGTGMPYWGPIFTYRQIQAIVDFLWIYQFDIGLE